MSGIPDFPVREDLLAADRHTWTKFSLPGTWWNGKERVAIMAHSRHARGLDSIPSRFEGVLPDSAIEAVTRISADLHHISRSWFDSLVEIGTTDGYYVEIISICSILAGIDRFYTTMGLELPPLPEPQAGEPSRYRPSSAILSDSAWVPMISPVTALKGPESDIYEGAKATAPVITAQSLVPDAIRLLNVWQGAHYMEQENGFLPMGEVDRALTRAQIEYVAGRVSAHNQCFY